MLSDVWSGCPIEPIHCDWIWHHKKTSSNWQILPPHLLCLLLHLLLLTLSCLSWLIRMSTSSQTGYKHLEELLRRKEHVILNQAQQISELKQELLLTQNLLNEAKRMPNIIAALIKIELNCKNEDAAINVKWVMSFGLELVGFGAKRQNVRDKLNLQRFRSHFGIGPEANVAIIAEK